MTFTMKTVLPATLLLVAGCVQGQFYKDFTRLKGATVAVSASEFFSTPVTNNSSPVTTFVPATGGGQLSQTVTNQQNNQTSKPGVLVSFGFHPVPFAGIGINYQFAQFDEVYFYNYSSTPTVGRQTRVPVAFNEFTGTYQFHPPHIKFQPYVNVGGGYIDFLPYLANNQWRGTGLVEAGFEFPLSKYPHLAVRLQGRALIYRIPNFDNPGISTRNWRVTEQPTAGFAYRF